MALSVNTGRKMHQSGPVAKGEHAVAAGVNIYQGAYVGSLAGLARGLTAGDDFLGIAMNQANNASGAAAAITVTLIREGMLSGVTITGASSAADVNKPVYASDDGTLTLTPGSNSKIGHVVAYRPDTSDFDVYFQSRGFRTGT